MQKIINFKKAILWGLVVYIIDAIVGNLLYQNPIVSGIYNQYSGHPSTKAMEFFGGLGNWLALTMLFGTFLTIILVALYLMLYKGLPGKGWRKGLFFGVMIGFIKAVPEAFNQWMIFIYPNVLILIQMINTLIGLTIFGIVLGFLFDSFNVITLGEKSNEDKGNEYQ